MSTMPATIQERVTVPARPAARFDAAGAGSAGLSVNDITTILKRRAVMIILCWLVFAALGVGGFFLVYFKYPTWVAEAHIECISDMPTKSGEFEDRAITEDRHERFVATQAMYAKSADVLNAVLQTPEVKATQWYRDADKTKLRLELEDAVSSSPTRGTNYFRIGMGCHNPADPRIIVLQIVQTYMERMRNRAADAYRRELESYTKEQTTLDSQTRQKLRQIQEFLSTMPPGETGIGDRYGPIVTEIMERQTQVTQLELQTLTLESYYQIYTNPEGPGVTPEDTQSVENDPKVISLQNQINALEQHLQILRADFGPAHREVKAAMDQLEVVQQQLARVREVELKKIIDLKQDQIQTSWLNSQHSLLLAQEKLFDARQKQADLERKQAELQTLRDEREMLKLNKERMDENIREVQRVVTERNAVRIDVAQVPVDPLERSFPKLIMLPGVVVLALFLAMGLAIGLELLDTTVRTPQDIVRHLRLPLLGTVPHADDEEVDIQRVETAVRDAPRSMIAEAFRGVRTNLQFSAPPDRQRSLLVTSPRPDDGKTTIACNLAAAQAMAGRRVLLVDANLRRPALHRVFEKVPSQGLSNCLVGGATLDQVVTKTSLANLDVVGSGPTPPNPAELLNSELARRFIEQALGRYDQVILDTPPVLLASDAAALGGMVDGVILVCRAKDNSRGQAQRAVSLLDHVGANVFGGVLNGAQVRRGGYFREQLRTYYEYQEEEGDDGRAPALPSDSRGRAIDRSDDEGKA